MRLADVILRGGHLSDRVLVEVWTTGLRPAHLDDCGRCAGRALELSRWLDDVQAQGRADADAVFSDSRLAGQRESILDRIAQLERPAKVLSFPAATAATHPVIIGRRIGTGWVAAAAAAGLMIGVVSVELSHLWPAQAPTQAAAVPAPPAPTAEDFGLLEAGFERPSFGALDDMTPSMADMVLVSNTPR